MKAWLGLGRTCWKNVFCIVFLFFVAQLVALSDVRAETTGTWSTSGSSGTAPVLGITVSQSGTLDGSAYTNQNFNSGSYWTNPYPGGSPSGGPGLWFTTPTDPNATRTVTVTFSKPVDNPVLHVNKIGGYARQNGSSQAVSNTSVWTLSGSQSQSGSVSFSRLSGNPQFEVGSNYFQRIPNVSGVSETADCTANASGTGCGSVQINGTGITRLTFTVTSAGATLNNARLDGLSMRWSFVGSTVTVKKQSVGSTGSFAFNANQGIGSFNLNTAQNNPATSATYPIQDHSQAINITETVPAGTSLTAECVDEDSGTVPSSLNGGQLTISSGAYDGNDQLTCTFTNTKLPTLRVTKRTEDGTGTFNFSGTNGVADHSITTTSSAAPVNGPVQTLAAADTATSVTEEADPAYYDPEVSCTGLGEGGSYSVSGHTVDLDEAATAAGAAIQCTFVNRRKLPVLEVEKVVDKSSISAPGTLNYTITVRNTGDGDATNISISDTLPDGSDGSLTGPSGDGGTANVLDAGETWTYTATYEATQDDIDNGETLVNNVSVTSAETPSAVTAEAETRINQSPSLAVNKTVDKARATEVGETLTYTITVENTGNVSQTGINISDTLPDDSAATLTGPSGDNDPTGTLDVDETWTYTTTYTVTQADIDAGDDLVNNVSITSDQVTTAVEDDATTQVQQVRSLSIDKVVDQASTDTAGDVLNYTITARNTGNVALENVSVMDTLPDGSPATLTGPSGDANGNGLLDVEERWTWTTTYTVTQADIDAGDDLVNQVSATADGIARPVSDRATTGISTSSGIDIKKDVDRDSISAPGRLNYTITVTNTGNTTLENVSLTDTLPDGSDGTSQLVRTDNGNGDELLDPGEVWTYTIYYDVTQEDINSGEDLVNNVAVTATDPSGESQDSDSAVTSVNTLPRLDVSKTVDRTTVSAPGTLTYTIRAKNTGNVDLDNVTFADSLSNGGTPVVSGPVESGDDDDVMDVGEVWTWTVTYEVIQDDIEAGDTIVNTATVSATGPDGTQTSDSDDAQTTVQQDPSLAVSKTVNKSSTRTLGDVLTYAIRVENTGNIAQTGIVISDRLPDGSEATLDGPEGDGGTAGTLDVGETWTYTTTYTVTQDDLNSGEDLVNRVSVSSDQVTTAVEDDATTAVEQRPSLSIDKVQSSGPSLVTAQGQEIGYTITVRNTGNIRQTGIDLSDTLPNGQPAQLDGPTGDSGEAGVLDAGETWTWTTSYVVTQADIDSGADLVNNASVTSDQVTDPVSDSETTEVEATAAITLTKTAGAVTDANNSGRTDAGDTITYSFSVENTGAVTLSNVMVTDGMFDPADFAVDPDTLAPGETGTATRTYTLTQTDVDQGSVSNYAEAVAAPPSGDDVRDDDSTVTQLDIEAELTLAKSAGAVEDANGNGRTDAGDTITYSFSVENTGAVTIDNVTVSDPKLGLTDAAVTPSTLAPGETGMAEAVTYTLTQADIDAGEVENTATASGTVTCAGPLVVGAQAVCGDPVRAEDTVTTPVEGTPELTLTKTAGEVVDANGNGRTDAGDTITYSFSVENSGTVTIENVTVSDPKLGLTDAAVTPGTLAPGETGTASATYTLTQADIDAGEVENTATASGTPPGGGDPVTAEDTVTTPVEGAPELTLTKSAGAVEDANGNGRTDAGDTITYSFSVENSGTVTIENVTVSDPKLGLTDAAVTPGTLAPGETGTASATYTLTQADIDAGEVENTATASGTPPGGGDPVTAEDTITTPVESSPALTLTKTAGEVVDANGNGRTDAGDTITYTFSVENSGTVTIENVTVSDPKLGLTDAAVTPSTLAPGETGTAEAVTYTLTQADIDAGEVENTATASGTPPGGGDPVTAEDTITTPVESSPALTLTKTAGEVVDANGNGRTDAGDTITYSFSVENTGAVTIDNVTVSDPKLGLTDAAVTPSTLAPGETGTAEAVTYTLTQADIDAGEVENTATASGTPPGGGDPVTAEDTVTTPVEGAPELTLTKSAGAVEDANGNGRTDAGDTITYSFSVENSGTVTIENVTVSDPKLGLTDAAVTPSTLAPGETGTAEAVTYTLTQADIDAGEVENTATASGTPPGGGDPVTAEDTVTTPVEGAPELTLTKSAGAVEDANGNGRTDAGDTITYSFSVENTGSVTISNVTVDDAKVGLTDAAVTPGTLAPGETGTASATYTLTQADIDAGEVENTATASGTPPGGGDPVTAEDTVTTPVEGVAELTIEKRAGEPSGSTVGSTIDYTFTVTNTGTVTLTGVMVEDALEGVEVSGGPVDLAPGQVDTTTFTARYTLTQDDLNRGEVVNSATATGTPPGGGEPVKSDPSEVTTPLDPKAELTLVKRAGEPSGNTAGSTISYTFEVTNTGDVNIENITLSDDLAGVEISGGPIERLEPGQTDSTTFTARYTLTQEDIERGEVVNSATVTGTPTNGDEPVESDPSETTTPIEQDPRLELIKSGRVNDADGNGVIEAGDALTYSFEVTNTGNVIITDIQPVDEGPSFNGNPGTGRLGTFTPGPTTLEPGATQVFTATYTLMQADVDNAAGVEDGVTNTATARGYHNGDATTGTEVSSDESSTSVELPAAPPSEIEITKQAGLRQIRRGEKAPFTIVVTNKANRMVSGVNVVDTIPAGFRFVEGSASIDGEAATPVVAGANVTFKNLRLEPNGQVVIRLQMQALSTAGPGRHINRANVTDPGGNRLAPEATAPIEIMVEPVFDCGEIIGKVFDDRNANGYQDEGEPGLPGVRVVTVRGKLITTDKHGRFHVACADLPDQRIGSNFIMKLDERTLPTGYRVTTENPRVVRLTAGKMTKLNFGASLGRVVRLDLNDAAFVAGSTELQPQWRKGIDQLIAVLAEKQSTLRINYQSNAGQLASSRLRAVQADIQNRWKKTPRNYQLNIETRLENDQ
jgi:uncharacterized repeat protein (TIGR01451 family)